jgi:hypothetical protein
MDAGPAIGIAAGLGTIWVMMLGVLAYALREAIREGEWH